MQSLDGLLDLHHTRLSRLHRHPFTIKKRHLSAVNIQHFGNESERTRYVILITNLRLCMDHRLVVGDVEVGGIDIGTYST